MDDNFQKIKIENKEYYIIDSLQNLRAEDSFIHRNNKLKIFKGNGESRKYVGSYIGSSRLRLNDFFEYNNWGETINIDGKRTYPIIQKDNCFFSKSNLLKYLYDSRIEYQKQEQVYNFDISNSYNDNLNRVNAIKNDKEFFSIYDISDLKDNKLNRAYIRSDDEIWETWRKLVLPKISYLSILKLIPISNDSEKKTLFYFRILLDYQFRSIVHPKLIGSSSEIVEKMKVQKRFIKSVSRITGDQYRKKVLDHMPQSPFTLIKEDKLLIASHIKPYNVCIKKGRDDQAIDYINGLTLTPTYDKLFDQGYITFTNDGNLVCGTLLSAYTWEKLNINPTAKNKLRIFPENRKEYLEYHRRNVFQDDIDDLL